MKHRISTLVAVWILSLIACQGEAQVTRDITLLVRDEAGRPLAGAEAKISFERIGGRDDNKGLTNENGKFGAGAEMSLGTTVLINKPGYYGIRIIDLGSYGVPPGKITLPLVMPRVVQPTALHALRASPNLPIQNVWLGYDFEAADWVTPYGKGKTTDVRFRFNHEFKGYLSEGGNLNRALEISKTLAERSGKPWSEDEFKLSAGKWDGVLEISCPHPQEGIVEETERYLPYGELKLPHLAPESGYEPIRRYEANTYRTRQPERQVGFFLRTRVVLDTNGEIISANYAKIYGDIHFDARGTLNFWYYFNPTPNDRNLEFDPKRNLFPPERPGAQVQNP